MSRKVSLKERVIAELKGGDDAKLVKFESKLEKYYEKKIKSLRDLIETIDDKIDDENEKLQNIIISPDMDELKTEGGAHYCPIYFSKVQDQMDVISRLEAQKDNHLAEIDKLNKIYETIYPEV